MNPKRGFLMFHHVKNTHVGHCCQEFDSGVLTLMRSIWLYSTLTRMSIAVDRPCVSAAWSG